MTVNLTAGSPSPFKVHIKDKMETLTEILAIDMIEASEALHHLKTQLAP